MGYTNKDNKFQLDYYDLSKLQKAAFYSTIYDDLIEATVTDVTVLNDLLYVTQPLASQILVY